MNLTPLQLNYSDLSAPDIFRLHQEYSKGYDIKPRPTATGDLRRIGIIGGDFRRHSCMMLLLPILRNTSLNTTIYMTGSEHDHVTETVKSLASFHDVSDMDARKRAGLIRSHGVQCLIDLSGYTGGNALDVLAEGAAPMQVTYMGYPNTLGGSLADFRIVDHITDLPSADDYHSERLARMPGCFLTFEPPAIDAPIVERDWREPPVFGCFANFCKLNTGVVDAWSEILHGVPDALLFLKSSRLYTSDPAGYMRQQFATRGIDPARLIFETATGDQAKHLNDYNRVDVQLDTFPYNGTATTCEALWMGVPPVTLSGRDHRSRVSRSLLTACDHTELCTVDVNDYIQTAMAVVKLARRFYRPTLRGDLLRSELCNHAQFTRQFDEMLHTLWRQL